MSELITALRQEQKALEAELSTDPRYRKLAKIRELLAIYEVGTPVPFVAPQPAAGLPDSNEAPSKADRVRAEAKAFIERSGGTAHRQAILDHLIELGVMGRERSPIASFAAYLTEMEEFVGVGGGRWAVRSGVDTPKKPPRKLIYEHIPGSDSARIVEFTAGYLRKKGSRAQAPEIIEAMRAEGVNFSVGAVSSNLSHSALFDNVRGEGYGLREWSHSPKTEAPNSGELFGAPRSNGVEPLHS